MNNAIGGYFELELQKGEHYHKDAIRLNSARNCFEYILEARRYTKVYLPYYTCEVMLQPLKRLDISYEFYSIDGKLEPIDIIDLKDGEAFLYTNYFGLKQDCAERLARVYGSRLIVDNAQAFYAPRIDSIDTFYSPRKFFGVPDGGYLYSDMVLDRNFEIDRSVGRFLHLIQRIEGGAELGYRLFRQSDDSLDNQQIRKMSELTERILSSIDYESIKISRRNNYTFLDGRLKKKNRIELELSDNAVPMVYPYYTDNPFLRKCLIDSKVFIATYWPNVFEWCSKESLEHGLAQKLIPLPIDQRYGEEELSRILQKIEK